MTDPDPLREYMRVTRALNLCKLRLLSIEAKLRRGGGPAHKEMIRRHQEQVAADMEALRNEGEHWLKQLRRRGS